MPGILENLQLGLIMLAKHLCEERVSCGAEARHLGSVNRHLRCANCPQNMVEAAFDDWTRTLDDDDDDDGALYALPRKEPTP